MVKHYHLVGIGGIGMSGIAQLLLRRGMQVSGSDLKESSITQELRRLGVSVFIGHEALHIKGADAVIYSSAIKDDNVEIKEAKMQCIPLLRRAEALAGLMEKAVVITVTGSHGKTTTASLVSCLLLEARFYPTVAVGGIVKNIDTNAYLGDGKFFVAEADESDASFLNYRPTYSIITNIDYEHLDYYKNFNNVLTAFEEFLNNTEKNGCVFACGDDVHVLRTLRNYKHRTVLFGLNKDCQMYAERIELKALTSQFDCYYNGKFVDRFYLALGGRHNVSNALAVIALGLELKIDPVIIKSTLANYKGTHRRLEVKYAEGGLTVIDDYAHHPTEIQATLAAAKNLDCGRLVAIFQPHRYTRTKLLLDDFGKSFDQADYVIITDIYPASEPPLSGVSGKRVAEKIKERSPEKEVVFLPKEEILQHLMEIKRPRDLIITLGAGDIIKVCEEFVEKLSVSAVS